MPEKCQHPEVIKQTREIPDTRWEPAETETRYVCVECGAELDAHQLDDAKIISE